MTYEKNKKILIRRQNATWFFVFLLIGSFLFGVNVLAANEYSKATSSTPVSTTWNTISSNYDKPFSGTLSAFEWNGLAYDFVNTWATSTMAGPLGIGTVSPSASLDIFGNVKITSGGTIYNTDNSRWLDMTGVLTDSLNVSGDLYSTGGELKIAGTGFSYLMGNVGVGTTVPGAKLDVRGNINVTGTLTVSGYKGINAVGSQPNIVQRLQRANGYYAYSIFEGYAENTTTGLSSKILNYGVYGDLKSGSVAPTIVYSYFGVGPDSDHNNASMRLYNNANKTVSFDGFVGIGTTAPGYKSTVYDLNGNYFASALQSGSIGTVGNWVGQLYGYGLGANYNKGATIFQSIDNNGRGNFYIALNDVADASNVTLANAKLTVLNGGNVGIGTTAPGSKLSIAGGDLELDNNKSIKINSASTNTTLLLGNYLGTTTSFTYGTSTTNLTASLAVEGDVKADRLCIEEDCKAAWGEIVSAGGGNQWITLGNNIYNSNTTGNVGIGTTNPTSKLYVNSGGGASSGIILKSDGTTGSYASFDYLNQGNTRFQTGLYDSGDAFFYMPAAGNNIGFYTSDTQRMTIAKGGNVGIGTTNPLAKLDISGTTGEIARFASLAAGTDSNYISLGNTRAQFGFNGITGNAVVQGGGGKGIELNVNNVFGSGTAMIINTTGNVGIGIASPTARLTLGTTGLISTDNAFRMGGEGNFIIDAPGIQGGRMTINSLGNVGIGTSSPLFKLDVIGTGSFTQPVIVGTPTAINHSATKSYVDSAISSIGGGIGTGTLGQTLRNDGTGWIANSLLYNDGTNVGVGTTSPAYPLTVNGIISFATQLRASNLSDKLILRVGSGIGTELHAGDVTGIIFKDSSNTETMRIINSGNVGISTITPSFKLDVNGSAQFNNTVVVGTPTALSHAATKSYVDSAVSSIGGGVATGTIGQTLRNDGTGWIANSLLYNNGTNIGIGTTNPIDTLQVKTSGQGSLTFGGSNGRTMHAYDSAGNPSNFDMLAASTYFSGNALVGGITEARGGIANDTGAYLTINGGTSGNTYFSGNVGIGTTNPFLKLDIRGAVAVVSGLNNVSARPAVGNTRISGEIAGVNSGSLAADDGFLRLSAGGGTGSNQKSFIDLSGYSTVGDMSNNIVFGTNGTEAMRIFSGKVGIGTTSPSFKLDVNGSAQFNNTVIVGSPTANNHAATKSYVDSAVSGVGGGIGAGTLGQTLRNDGTGWIANSLLYNDGNNVGIGTTAPTSKLHIEGNSGELILRLNNTAAGGRNWELDSKNTSGSFSILDRTAGTDRFLITSSGNIGIGTINPTLGKLQVYGSVVADGMSSGGAGVYGYNGGGTHIFSIIRQDGIQNASVSFSSYGGIGFTGGKTIGNEATNYQMFLNNAGNVGISTTSPSFKLDVNGSAQFNNTVVVGAPTALNHAATKSYVDSAVSGVGGGVGVGTVGQTLRNDGTGWIANSLLYNNGINVGIGTTTPNAKFNINNNIAFSVASLATAIDSRNAFRIRGRDTAVNTLVIGSSGINDYVIQNINDAGTGANNILINPFGGNVGVGTASPQGKLDVDTGGNARLVVNSPSVNRLQLQSLSGTSDQYFDFRGYDFTFKVNGGATAMFIKNDGYVGIGTTAPVFKLDVAGTGSFNQPVIVGTPTAVNHAATKSYVDSAAASTWTVNGLNIYNSNSGNVGIGTTTPTEAKLVINAGTGMALKAYGNGIFTGTLQTQTGSDFAEEFSTTKDLEPGTVVVMGDGGHKSVKPCAKSYDKTVVGIVSNNPSIIAGRVESEHKAIIAMMGVVKVKVTSVNGSISKGDLLTTSKVNGYAMKALETKAGTIIGKALEDLNSITGEINVLVNLQ